MAALFSLSALKLDMICHLLSEISREQLINQEYCRWLGLTCKSILWSSGSADMLSCSQKWRNHRISYNFPKCLFSSALDFMFPGVLFEWIYFFLMGELAVSFTNKREMWIFLSSFISSWGSGVSKSDDSYTLRRKTFIRNNVPGKNRRWWPTQKTERQMNKWETHPRGKKF